MAKKKIIFLITKSNWGGAQKYVFELATSLSYENFNILVVLGGEGELKSRLEEKGIQTISLKNLKRDVSLLKELLILKELISIFKKERPDIIHVNSSKIGGLGSFAGRITGVKNILFTAHGWAFKESRDALVTGIIKFFSWLTIIFSHKVIVLSKIEKEFVVSWPFCATKLYIVPIGIKDISFLSKEEARKQLGIQNVFTVFGNIAELHKNKGLEYALRAFAMKKESNIIYEIIGDGEEKEKLQNISTSLDIEKKVIFLGKILDGSTFLKAFDYFLFPSIKEGLPYTLLEAGLASLPIIATNVGGIPEVIENMQNGLLIPAKNPEAIKNAIDFYLSHPEKAKEFGAKLREKVLRDFSLENMVESTIALYQE